jgi:hypothetical protein
MSQLQPLFGSQTSLIMSRLTALFCPYFSQTEEAARVGDTVALEVCDANENNTKVTGVVAERYYRGQLLPR